MRTFSEHPWGISESAIIASASQENVTNGAVFADGQIAVRYPVALLEDLGAGFHWSAAVTLNGQDVDLCGDESPIVTVPED